jgi:hypothetical protein
MQLCACELELETEVAILIKCIRSLYIVWSRGSSVSIVSGYGLDDQAIEVRSLAEERGFFL